MHTKRGFDEDTFLFVTRQIVTPDGVPRATEPVAPSVRSGRL